MVEVKVFRLFLSSLSEADSGSQGASSQSLYPTGWPMAQVFWIQILWPLLSCCVTLDKSFHSL